METELRRNNSEQGQGQESSGQGQIIWLWGQGQGLTTMGLWIRTDIKCTVYYRAVSLLSPVVCMIVERFVHCCWTGLASWSSAVPVIVRRPQSAVREVGGSVQLDCSISETYQNYFEWRHYLSPDLNSKQVYSTFNNSAFVRGPDFPADRFHRTGQYGLRMTNLAASDGALFSCHFSRWSLSASANVFVIGE